jgi:hypothetical protein
MTIHYMLIHCILIHYMLIHCILIHCILIHYMLIHCILIHYMLIHCIGELVDDPAVGGGAGHDGTGEWYAHDEVPPTVMSMLKCFFVEMWPVLVSTMGIMGHRLKGNQRTVDPLPSKSFGPTTHQQMGSGSLTHEFTLPVYHRDAAGPGNTPRMTMAAGQSVKGRRMVVPYHLYMLQGLCDDYLTPARTLHGDALVQSFLKECGDMCGENNQQSSSGDSGSSLLPSLMALPELLSGCRVEKRGGKIYHLPAAAAPRARL